MNEELNNGSPLQLIKLVSARAQIVAGKHYVIEAILAPAVCAENVCSTFFL